MPERQIIDAMWDDSPVDVSKETSMIWSIANKLRGTYQSDKYKEVIIPMTIIRRFECALAATKDKVLALYDKNPNYPPKALCKAAGFQFYNTSRFTLGELCNDPDHLAPNFISYIEGFSSNVQEILLSEARGLDFGKQITKMDKNNRLLAVVKAFSELDLDPQTIDNVKMGYIFEDLIRRFSENAEAGDHYTGRDIIKLMVNILLSEGCDDIFDDGKIITILDQACGTGGMLSTGYNFIKRYNPTADVILFGQEINPESYAMCLAEMLIKGQKEENIRYQDTMKADCFPDYKMRFVLENPPFGQAWGGKDAAEGVEAAVKDEYAKGFDGRWGAGLPGTGDMQMLFLQSAVNKMDDQLGRCAIIETARPSSRAARRRAKARFAAGSWKMTSSKPSSPCRRTFSTIRALRPISGSSPRISGRNAKARSSLSTPARFAILCASPWAISATKSARKTVAPLLVFTPTSKKGKRSGFSTIRNSSTANTPSCSPCSAATKSRQKASTACSRRGVSTPFMMKGKYWYFRRNRKRMN